MSFLQKQRNVISVAEVLGLKDEEIKQIKKRNEGKGRGKKLETENKELKDENRKNNNVLKELEKVIIWLNMKISGNTSTTESHYCIYRLGDGIIIIQLFTIKYAWKSCFIQK